MQPYDWVTAGIYAFGLPPTKTRSGTAREFGPSRAQGVGGGQRRDMLGAPAGSVGLTERWFPSGDESDAAFLGKTESLIVEVRPQGAEPHELQQALFTLVKMRAVMQAEQSLADAAEGQSGTWSARRWCWKKSRTAESIKELAERTGRRVVRQMSSLRADDRWSLQLVNVRHRIMRPARAVRSCSAIRR